MKIRYSSTFYHQYKKADVRIRKNTDKLIDLFSKNPNDLQLNNHALKREWKGLRSIDITADWRAIYRQLTEGEEHIAYFIALGTHSKLYKPRK